MWSGTNDKLWLTSLMLTSAMLGSYSDGYWWSPPNVNVIATLSNASTSLMCDSFNGLSGHQRRLCRKHHDHMQFVIEGSHNAIVECKRLFKSNRWNCPTVQDSHRTGSAFGRLLDTGARETAFAQAITSAGIVHSVMRACRRDFLEGCDCMFARDPPKRDLLSSDDSLWCQYIDYATEFARKFTDGRSLTKSEATRTSAEKLMELHNNKIGRMAVKQASRVRCKCHGMKGACNLKTCWLELADFQNVGRRLKKAYENAVRVKTQQGRLISLGQEDLESKNLGYLQPSPNFCQRDKALGIRGTRDRICQLNSHGSDSCVLLCCGRGYINKTVQTTELCNCVFSWCCEVRCMKCVCAFQHEVCL